MRPPGQRVGHRPGCRPGHLLSSKQGSLMSFVTRALARALPAVPAMLAALLANSWAGPALAATDSVSLSLTTGQGALTPAVIQLFLIITLLSVAPGLLMMVTSFTKIVIVLSVMRSALGLQASPPNMVISGLALFLTLFVMQPTLEVAWNDGVRPYMDGQITEEQAFERSVDPFRDFMTANVREQDVQLLLDISEKRKAPGGAADASPGAAPRSVSYDPATASGKASAKPSEEIALTTLIPAFMVSEIHKAFMLAFAFYLPFIVIDLAVSSALMAMGMMMLSPAMISLPLKLIFFVLMGGFGLISGTLTSGYS
ncbi:flagellar type III secretion system pore protein FliP [Azospirillum sp. SYSU D00513]|uniref:flagellar type III secretion system pore protein FliP n=1 Tax=Azospirillum sp. SYSU D00513 TaxID=2812561 RepID=UPI0032B425D4